MLTVTEIKTLHDKGYVRGQTNRERGADDLLFYWITQWDDTNLGGSTLQYRGQFDMLRKAGRQIISDIKSNPTQVDFEPDDETDPNGAEIADGMYRTDMRNNIAIEARETATTETIVCGFGAWELQTEYKSRRAGDDRQVIRRQPLNEANNTVFWDPNAKLQDKSDADWVSILVPYSGDGYRALVKELTGDDIEISDIPASFAYPEQSYVFPWLDDGDLYYVDRFYHREKIKVKTMVFRDMMGSEKLVDDHDELEEEIEELNGKGFEMVSESEREVYQISLYIVGGGDEVLQHDTIPGDNIPVIPMYGERAFVEGQEHYEGIVRLAKDPQRLRNFVNSYLADIVSKSPRAKNIYWPEQIQGFEEYYNENGADEQFPYALMQRKDGNSEDLPNVPIGTTGEQKVPDSLVMASQMAREAISDVANSDLPQDVADTNLSGKALIALQKRFDMQSYIYQHNLKTALRREGEIWVSMKAAISDVEEDVTLTKIDGTRTTETINQEEINPETLRTEVKNDVNNWIFSVYADIGPSYQSQKEEDRVELAESLGTMPPDDPMRSIVMLTVWSMKEGEAFKSLREYAKKQLILEGINEPETDEEKQMLAEAQQAKQQQQDPNMVLAQAEMGKAQAENTNAQTKVQDTKVDMFNAETKRAEVMIKAKEAGVNIDLKRAQTVGVRVDTIKKIRGDDLRQRVG